MPPIRLNWKGVLTGAAIGAVTHGLAYYLICLVANRAMLTIGDGDLLLQVLGVTGLIAVEFPIGSIPWALAGIVIGAIAGISRNRTLGAVVGGTLSGLSSGCFLYLVTWPDFTLEIPLWTLTVLAGTIAGGLAIRGSRRRGDDEIDEGTLYQRLQAKRRREHQ